MLWARELHALGMGLQDFAMHQCLISALIVSDGEFCGFRFIFYRYMYLNSSATS